MIHIGQLLIHFKSTIKISLVTNKIFNYQTQTWRCTGALEWVAGAADGGVEAGVQQAGASATYPTKNINQKLYKKKIKE